MSNTDSRIEFDFNLNLADFICMDRDALTDYVCNFVLGVASLAELEVELKPSLGGTVVELKGYGCIEDQSEYRIVDPEESEKMFVCVSRLSIREIEVDAYAPSKELAELVALENAVDLDFNFSGNERGCAYIIS